ncbi:MAG: HTH domain-containing protein [Myxococcales bacterium]|nr:HTH domain-containing protein [Myxococcales bacterium]
MTFTEAAIAVLRAEGKPLHYRRITELAIERNLLSHVGRAPEVTMSARLAMLVKKDRGDAPVIKVGPGIFGIRDASSQSADAAVLMESSQMNEDKELMSNAATGAVEGEKRKLPGEDVFPAEDDDDLPILSAVDREPADAGSRRSQAPREDDDSYTRRRRSKGAAGHGRVDEPRHADGVGTHGHSRGEHARSGDGLRGDWSREPRSGEPAGSDLADAVRDVLEQGGRSPQSYSRLAEALVRRGKLAGPADALAPTIAAAVRSDNASRVGGGQRPRFRVQGDRVSLTDWTVPPEALRFERDAIAAASRQRDAMRRAILRRMAELPAAGVVELLASVLHAEGVAGLRAVRRPGTRSGDFHLVGVRRAGASESRLAIVYLASDIGREHVIEARGALHHYEGASALWMLTLREVKSGARDEAAAPGVAPVALYDGQALVRMMERAGLGVVRHHVRLLALDVDLFESLGLGFARPHAEARRDAQPAASRATFREEIAPEERGAMRPASGDDANVEGLDEADVSEVPDDDVADAETAATQPATRRSAPEWIAAEDVETLDELGEDEVETDPGAADGDVEEARSDDAEVGSEPSARTARRRRRRRRRRSGSSGAESTGGVASASEGSIEAVPESIQRSGGGEPKSVARWHEGEAAAAVQPSGAHSANDSVVPSDSPQRRGPEAWAENDEPRDRSRMDANPAPRGDGEAPG